MNKVVQITRGSADEVRIDSGVPLARLRDCGGGWNSGLSKYPFGKLQPGQSFFVPAALAAVSSAKGKWSAKHPGAVLRCRTVTESGVKGVRTWRIS